MILPTVELTKIHFYNPEIPTISREIIDNHVNAKIKRKKFFRNRWVLKINEIGGGTGEKFQWRLVVYLLGLSCLVVALVFALYFTCFAKIETEDDVVSEVILLPSENFTTHEKVMVERKFCQDCDLGEFICLKREEIGTPECVRALDKKDPTGCGGFCEINKQFCQLLDINNRIYQCSNLKNVLKCPRTTFNCGNMCIHGSKRCDGIIHCSNKADEVDCDCDLDNNFRCGNATSCLPKSKRCDGFVDCWDKSDEIDCKLGCKDDTIPCLNGDCIPKSHFCDGKYHCSDRSDEPQGCQL